MNSVNWHFREKTRVEMNQDIQLVEFFADEPINTRLAREVIQNSLDAGFAKQLPDGHHNDQNPVKVRFSLNGLSEPLRAERAERYFAGLSEHLSDIEGLDDAVRAHAVDGTLLDSDVKFIVIEDSGTVGLCGAPERHEDPPPDSMDANDFYWFFRNVGRSGKRGSDNGSWGLGKWVFPDASGASTFFALTTTDDDTLLMGQTILQEHHFSGRKYAPYGYWSDPDEDGFAMPFRLSRPEHRPIIEDFISDFGLKMRDEPGLSVVIPFPRVANSNDGESDGTNTHELVNAVVHNYFYPIVRGWLEVSVGGDAGQFPVQINSDTIRDVVQGIDTSGPDPGQWTPRSYRRVFRMLDETANLHPTDFIQLSEPPTQNDGYVHTDDLRGLRDRYEAGDLLPFNIRTTVRRKNNQTVDTEFKVYIRCEPELDIGHDYFIRGTLSIPAMDYIKKHKALALIVVDQYEPLSEMLQDSEPPAHTMWRPQAQRVRDRWVSPQRRINGVRDTTKNILWHLEEQHSGLQTDAFLDLFAVDALQNAAAGSGSRSGTSTRSRKKAIPNSPAQFAVSQSRGGFRVAPSKGVDIPRQVVLRVAYDVPRGDPFAKFDKNDFSFRGARNLRVKIDDGEIVNDADVKALSNNAVKLRVKDPNSFSFSVSGFDEFRDVVVRIDPDIQE